MNKSQGLWVLDTTDNQRVEKEEDEAPPPMPSRPTGSNIVAPEPVVGRSNTYEQEENVEHSEHSYDGEFSLGILTRLMVERKEQSNFQLAKG